MARFKYLQSLILHKMLMHKAKKDVIHVSLVLIRKILFKNIIKKKLINSEEDCNPIGVEHFGAQCVANKSEINWFVLYIEDVCFK